MHKFKELVVWQKSVDLTVYVYSLTTLFPKKEDFGLTTQINRACVSIAFNIAEGAVGSSFEAGTRLIIANRLEYISQESFEKAAGLISEVQNMLFHLQQKLNT